MIEDGLLSYFSLTGMGEPPEFEGEPPEFEGEPPEFEGEPPEFEGEPPEFEGSQFCYHMSDRKPGFHLIQFHTLNKMAYFSSYLYLQTFNGKLEITRARLLCRVLYHT
jgi:hypothetical protein